MKKVAVLLHIFYQDQSEYFIHKLQNINGCEWDLFVTYPELSESKKNKFRKLKEDVKFIQVENVGYDVWPFIKIFKSEDLSSYDYLMKLHTKNHSNEALMINGLKLKADSWRNLLVDSMLRNTEQFRKCLNIFEKNDKVGLVCSYELFKGLKKDMPEEGPMLENEAERISMKIKDGYFCAGTMFMVRPEVLSRIKRSRITVDMWAKKSKTHSSGTLAHVYERLLGILVHDAGYEIRTVITYPKKSFRVFCHKVFSPMMKFIFTLDRDMDKRKYLNIFGIRIYLSK